MLTTKNLLIIGGEVATDAQKDIENVIKELAQFIGYTYLDLGFIDQCQVQILAHEQAPEFDRNASMVGPGDGDQGLLFGIRLTIRDNICLDRFISRTYVLDS